MSNIEKLARYICEKENSEQILELFCAIIQASQNGNTEAKIPNVWDPSKKEC